MGYSGWKIGKVTEDVLPLPIGAIARLRPCSTKLEGGTP
jgi:hypothetical protein